MVVDSKLKSGKARALYDWKISYKYFNAWKKTNLTEKIKKAQKFHEDVIKFESIKMSKAVNYCNMRLMRRCLDTWKEFIRGEKQVKQLAEEKNKAKNKIEMFLEAAAQGKLNTTTAEQNSSHNESINSHKNKQQQQIKPPKSQRTTTSRTTTPTSKSRPKSALDTSLRKPSTQRNEATINDADHFDDSELLLNIPDTEREALMSKQVRKMMWPWVKTPFVINNYENRYKAHDRLLQEQQKMIKEQQRVIEDMKFQQSQMAFKEQITLLEQIKQKQEELERMQKAQYGQEKKLLMEAAYARNNNNNNKLQQEPVAGGIAGATEENDDLPQTVRHDEQSKVDTTITSNQHRTSTLDTSKTPRFLKTMDERARQREQVRLEREERKKQQEMEKLKQLQEKQEEKMRVEEEERRKRNEELREKRRIEKDLKDKREVEKRHEEILMEKADAFYKKYLMRHYCLNGFRKVLEIREQKTALAIDHYNKTIQSRCFGAWKFIIDEQVSIKNHIADKFYKRYLVRHYFNFGWKNFKLSIRFEEAKAIRFYKYNLKVKMYNAIKVYTQRERVKYKEYNSWLSSYCEEKMKEKYFKKWKEFPDEMKKQREREKRLNDMRKKVQELVPDFKTKTSLNESTASTTTATNHSLTNI